MRKYHCIIGKICHRSFIMPAPLYRKKNCTLKYEESFPIFGRIASWNVRIATIADGPPMVCLDSPSSEETSCIFQDPEGLRGAYLFGMICKGLPGKSTARGHRARSTEDELYYRERQRARRSRYGLRIR